MKLEENSTLTVKGWEPNNPQGGYLKIRCLNDCILEENAKIDLSGKGYWGGYFKEHLNGYGKGGGKGGKYCAEEVVMLLKARQEDVRFFY